MPVGLIVLICALVALPVLLIIVGIVAAILLPVFAKAHDKAQQTACISNQRMLGTVMLSYAYDWGETLPPARDWNDALGPRAPQPAGLVCPTLQGSRCNYWLNEQAGGVRLADVRSPSAAVLTFEGEDGWNQAGGESEMLWPHNGGANIGYSDGHAKWSREGTTLTWDPGERQRPERTR